MSKVLLSREPDLWVVFDVAQRQHWPEGGDEDGCGGWSRSDNYERIVHVATSPERCREAMNKYFTEAKKKDSRMTCWFDDQAMQSSSSGNYNGGGYMSAYHHFEIRRAPSVEAR